MKMQTRLYWLPKPVDVKITDCPSVAGESFCIIRSDDFYEDVGEQDDEELARFSDVYDAFAWMSANGYAPIKSGCADGTYRHTQAAEWFYEQLDKKPVRVLKRKKEPVVISPVRQRIMLMLSA